MRARKISLSMGHGSYGIATKVGSFVDRKYGMEGNFALAVCPCWVNIKPHYIRYAGSGETAFDSARARNGG